MEKCPVNSSSPHLSGELFIDNCWSLPFQSTVLVQTLLFMSVRFQSPPRPPLHHLLGPIQVQMGAVACSKFTAWLYGTQTVPPVWLQRFEWFRETSGEDNGHEAASVSHSVSATWRCDDHSQSVHQFTVRTFLQLHSGTR